MKARKTWPKPFKARTNEQTQSDANAIKSQLINWVNWLTGSFAKRESGFVRENIVIATFLRLRGGVVVPQEKTSIKIIILKTWNRIDVVYSTGCFIYLSAPQKSIIDFTKQIHRAAMSHAQIDFDIFQFVNNRQTEISANWRYRFIAK